MKSVYRLYSAEFLQLTESCEMEMGDSLLEKEDLVLTVPRYNGQS